ncbi:T9SS type A sorting domain-containing protein [uncultured Chryseobacterium sp.]|uniref:T9SS type A sorting domain-containing protein n=1 Tax=uncultured Chryseobacterium sp. TaxID=259322 RepID=UPI0025ED938B|nr:T9SS type A sorting domain-containing protein [uncultured Chryseobacterium sp.]
MKKISTLTAIILLSLSSSHAQITLTKDVSFGNNGTVTIQDVASSNSWLLIIPYTHNTFQGNKIFVSYHGIDPNNPLVSPTQFTRLNSNGSLDTSFGNNGNILVPAFEAYYFYANENFFYLNSGKKYLSSGQQDAAFNTGPMQNNQDWNYKVVLSDNKILLRGDSTFTKYLTDGNPDSSYGINGTLAVSAPVAADANSSYEYFFGKDQSLYEFVDPSPGQSAVRKINVSTGTLDLSYGQSGYAQVRNTAVPAAAAFGGSVESPLADGSFINKLSDGSALYFTRTNGQGALDSSFGINGVVTGSTSFTSNGTTYSVSGMKPLLYQDMVLMPAQYTDSQGQTSWGVSAYSFNGSALTVNGSAFFPLTDFSYNSWSSLGFLFAKDDFLYAIYENHITRYVIQRPVLSLKEHPSDHENAIYFNNPFGNELLLQTKKAIKKIEIQDLTGRIVAEATSPSIDTFLLPSGNYVILITTEDNKVISRKGIKL